MSLLDDLYGHFLVMLSVYSHVFANYQCLPTILFMKWLQNYCKMVIVVTNIHLTTDNYFLPTSNIFDFH